MNLLKRIISYIKNSDFFKTFKEELVIIPLLLVIFYTINFLLIKFFPEGAYFDFFSQIETIVSKIVLYFITLWIAHLALKVSFPNIYKFLHDNIYHKFSEIPNDKKIEYAIKFILVFILSAALVFGAGAQTVPQKDIRIQLIDTVKTQLYVREITPNRSPMIDIYLTQVGAPLGSPWCGSFVGTNMTWVGIKNPNSGLARNYVTKDNIIWKNNAKNNKEPLPGDVVSYYYGNNVSHVGFYEKKDPNGYFITIEGNVRGTDGEGVHRLKREPNKIYAISRFIKVVPLVPIDK